MSTPITVQPVKKYDESSPLEVYLKDLHRRKYVPLRQIGIAQQK